MEINNIRQLNDALAQAKPKIGFLKGVKIELTINGETELYTRNAIVQLAKTLKMTNKERKEFNDVFQNLDNRAIRDLSNLSKKHILTKLMVKIKQALGNRSYNRYKDFPLNEEPNKSSASSEKKSSTSSSSSSSSAKAEPDAKSPASLSRSKSSSSSSSSEEEEESQDKASSSSSSAKAKPDAKSPASLSRSKSSSSSSSSEEEESQDKASSSSSSAKAEPDAKSLASLSRSKSSSSSSSSEEEESQDKASSSSSSAKAEPDAKSLASLSRSKSSSSSSSAEDLDLPKQEDLTRGIIVEPQSQPKVENVVVEEEPRANVEEEPHGKASTSSSESEEELPQDDASPEKPLQEDLTKSIYNLKPVAHEEEDLSKSTLFEEPKPLAEDVVVQEEPKAEEQPEESAKKELSSEEDHSKSSHEDHPKEESQQASSQTTKLSRSDLTQSVMIPRPKIIKEEDLSESIIAEREPSNETKQEQPKSEQETPPQEDDLSASVLVKSSAETPPVAPGQKKPRNRQVKLSPPEGRDADRYHDFTEEYTSEDNAKIKTTKRKNVNLRGPSSFSDRKGIKGKGRGKRIIIEGNQEKKPLNPDIHEAKKYLFSIFKVNIPLEDLKKYDQISTIAKNLKKIGKQSTDNRPAGFVIHENDAWNYMPRSAEEQNPGVEEQNPGVEEQNPAVQRMIDYILSGASVENAFQWGTHEGKQVLNFFPENTKQPAEDLTASELRRSIKVEEKEIPLTEEEFEMVEEAVEHPEEPQSKSFLAAIWEKAQIFNPISAFSLMRSIVVGDKEIPLKKEEFEMVEEAVKNPEAPQSKSFLAAIWEKAQIFNPISIVSYGAEALTALAGAVKTGAIATYETAQSAQEAKKMALKGIDFYPYLKGAGEVGVDYWNAPSEEYDPMIANVMNGFTNQFGNHLHNILTNGITLGSSKFSEKIAKKLNLGAPAAGVAVKQVVSFSNPLSWVGIVLSIAKTNRDVLHELNKGIFPELSAFIDKEVIGLAKKANLDPNYMQFLLLENLKVAALRRFTKEKDEYIQNLELKGLKPPEEKASGLRWFYLKGKEIFTAPWYEEHLKDAPASYKDAEIAYQEISKKLTEFQKSNPELEKMDFTSFEGAKAAVQYKGFLDIAVILKNSCRVTLEHMVRDISEMAAKGDEYGAEDLRAIISPLVLGAGATSLEETRLKKEAAAERKRAVAEASTAATNPLAPVVEQIPQTVIERANELLRPVSGVIGNLATLTLFEGNAIEAVNRMQLKDIHLFGKQQLEVDVLGKMPEGTLKTVVENLSIYYDFNTKLAQIFEKSGELIADRIGLQIAKTLKKKLKGDDFTEEQLMREEIPVGYFRQGLRKAGVAITQITAKTALVLGKTALEVNSIYSYLSNPTFPTDY